MEIKEHRLVFTPNDKTFIDFMKDVSGKLNFDEAIGVNNSQDLETTLNQRGLVAGIEFHHPSVSA